MAVALTLSALSIQSVLAAEYNEKSKRPEKYVA